MSKNDLKIRDLENKIYDLEQKVKFLSNLDALAGLFSLHINDCEFSDAVDGCRELFGDVFKNAKAKKLEKLIEEQKKLLGVENVK